jgi:hypothetical protein
MRASCFNGLSALLRNFSLLRFSLKTSFWGAAKLGHRGEPRDRAVSFRFVSSLEEPKTAKTKGFVSPSETEGFALLVVSD